MSEFKDPFAGMSEELGKVFDESQGAAAAPSPAASPSVEAVPDVPSPSEPAETPGVSSDDRPRGPDGKFLPKDKAEAKPAEDPKATTEIPAEPDKAAAEPTTDQPQSPGTLKAPNSWSAAAKAEWAKLPTSIQTEVLKREMDVERGFKQYGERVKTYEAIDKILDPLPLQQHGLSKAQYVERLRAAEVALERNPVQALQWLAKSYGVDLAQIATGQPETPADPTIAALRQEIEQLKSGVTAQQQAAQQAVEREIETELSKFASDPKNEFFEQVKADMGILIQNGRAKDLQAAYDMAVYANPETRAIIQARDADALQKKLLEDSRKQASQARKAAGTNVQGTAATPGQVPSMRSLMESTYDRLNGAA